MLNNSADRIRVMIIDHHAVVRTALARLIESRPHLTVVSEAANRAAALDVVARTHPSIILLDLDLGSESGLDLLPELLAAAPKAHVIVLTGLRDTRVHHQAVRLGAMGLVLKQQEAEVLFKAIEKVHAGETWLDRTMTANVLAEMTRAREAQETDPEAARIAALTGREREIITLVGEGLKNREIARRLCISETTVRHHLTSIFSKLGVSDRLELVIYAYRHNLAALPR